MHKNTPFPWTQFSWWDWQEGGTNTVWRLWLTADHLPTHRPAAVPQVSQQALPPALTSCFDVKRHSLIETIKAKLIQGFKLYFSIFTGYPRKTEARILTLLMCSAAMYNKRHHFSSPTKQSLVLNVFHWWKQIIVYCLTECSFAMRWVNSWRFC